MSSKATLIIHLHSFIYFLSQLIHSLIFSFTNFPTHRLMYCLHFLMHLYRFVQMRGLTLSALGGQQFTNWFNEMLTWIKMDKASPLPPILQNWSLDVSSATFRSIAIVLHWSWETPESTSWTWVWSRRGSLSYGRHHASSQSRRSPIQESPTTSGRLP